MTAVSQPRRKPTSTSDFGVGRREAHDSSGFYERFAAPHVSIDEDVNPYGIRDEIWPIDARAMDAGGERIKPNSVALVVTSPPVLRGQGLREGPRPPTTSLRPTSSTSTCSATCSPSLRRQARAGRAHRRQRRQPRAQAVPLAVGRRHRHPAGRPRPAAARRDHLEQGQEHIGQLRVGIVPERGQPHAARPHRAGHRRLARGASTARSTRKEREQAGTALREHDLPRRLHGLGHRRLGDRRRERHARRSPRAVPRRAPPAADRALHLPRRSRARPVHGLPAAPPSPPCAPTATTSASTSTRPTCEPPRIASPTRSPDATNPLRRATLAAGAAPEHRRRPRRRRGERLPGPCRRARASWPRPWPRSCSTVAGFEKVTTKQKVARRRDQLRGRATRRGTTWNVDVSGAFTKGNDRAGLRRTDTLWKALGKASVLHESEPRRPRPPPLPAAHLRPPGPRQRRGEGARGGARAATGRSSTPSRCCPSRASCGCVATQSTAPATTTLLAVDLAATVS